MGTVLGGVASNAERPEFLQRLLDMAPAGLASVGATEISRAATDPNSPLISAGRAILSTLFGGSETRIMQAVGTETGLPGATTSSLLAMAAPMVMSFLGKRAADQGLGATGLARVLQREAPTIRAALPSRISNLLGWRQGETVYAQPVPTRPVQTSSAGRWLVPLIIAALIPTLWLLSRARRPVVTIPTPNTGTAQRAMPEPIAPTPSLPGKLDVQFENASTNLQPDSEARLKDFAAAVAADPSARVSVTGHTDNVGSAEANVRLSQDRANEVKTALTRMGVSADRITAQGLGDQDPIADNSTAEGRAANRRVTVEASR